MSDEPSDQDILQRVVTSTFWPDVYAALDGIVARHGKTTANLIAVVANPNDASVRALFAGRSVPPGEDAERVALVVMDREAFFTSLFVQQVDRSMREAPVLATVVVRGTFYFVTPPRAKEPS